MMPSQFVQLNKYKHIKSQCSQSLDLYIADLRSMLQLPYGKEGDKVYMEGGCNFATCAFMLDIVAGLSVCLYIQKGEVGLETTNDRRDRFKKLLCQYYPWEYEDFSKLKKAEIIDILWKFLRNPLVHSMGILDFKGTSISITGVKINKSSLNLDEVLKLEDASYPRMQLSSTFELEKGTFHVNIPCLYWGLHQLLRKLFSDNSQMNQVETWYAKQ